jgi:histidyl-tRNA synthetase
MTVKTVKGFRDILPEEARVFRWVEGRAREIFRAWGFREIVPPILERTDLFSRTIGEATEIVEKQMYTFQDLHGDSLTLRPEGTASVVRAYVEHHLDQENPVTKLFYTGPMFRCGAQKGRYRQFFQAGLRCWATSPDADAEVISCLDALLRVGVADRRLAINSLGHPGCRPAYLESLRAYFGGRRDTLCADCRRKIERNPLRILDCKVDRCIEIAAGAPSILDHLCAGCGEHFDGVRGRLDRMGVKAVVDPRIVRGLDYYVRTAFEATTDRLGAKNAVAAGGRYDGLVKALGGPDIPGIGFAVGLERLISLLPEGLPIPADGPRVLLVGAGGEPSREAAFALADALRRAGVSLEWGGDRSLKAAMRRADRIGAEFVLILGDEELARDEVVLRDMRRQSQGSSCGPACPRRCGGDYQPPDPDRA